MFFTKRVDLGLDLIDHSTGLVQTFFVGASKLRRVWKRPVQSCSHTWKNRAPFCFGLTAHGNRIGKYVMRGLPNIEDGLRLIARNVDSSLLQCFYRQGIEDARFQPSALGFEVIAA